MESTRKGLSNQRRMSARWGGDQPRIDPVDFQQVVCRAAGRSADLSGHSGGGRSVGVGHRDYVDQWRR